MMEYGPWVHGSGVLDNHRFYNQLLEAPYCHQHIPEEDVERDDIQETMTSATSEERSSSADLFRLKFAATQWSKLVSNAEGLFTKLVASNILPDNEQDQIEQWLCLKQEYEECISNDDSSSLPGFPETNRRSLERIEEVTETDEKTDESANPEFHTESHSESDMCEEDDDEEEEEEDDEDEDEDEDEEEDEEEEEVDEEDEEVEVDGDVDGGNEEDEDEEEEQSDENSNNPDFLDKLDEFMNRFKLETDRLIESVDSSYDDKQLPIILSGNIPLSNINSNYIPIVKPIPIRKQNFRRNSMLPGSEMCNEVLMFNDGFKAESKSVENVREFHLKNVSRSFKDNSPDILVDTLKNDETISRKIIDNYEEVDELEEETIGKVKFIESELNVANDKIEELEMTIKEKEQLINNMIKNQESVLINSNCNNNINSNRNNGSIKKTNRKRVKLKKDIRNSFDKNNREIELCKNLAIHYEKKRLIDIEKIKKIADDSAKKVLELELTLNKSKLQMEILKNKLKLEENNKLKLEKELVDDQKKIYDLESKYQLTQYKLNEIKLIESSINSNDNNISNKLINKNNIINSNSKTIDGLKASGDEDGKLLLRKQIENLRHTKDKLVEQKCDLDEKLQKEKILTNDEERKRLECGETIEMIDAMIEHKNEMICGRKTLVDPEESEKIMIDKHLSKLSEPEMRQLFYAYFRKVIDLKESSRALEVQMAGQDALVESQESNIRTLTNLLRQMKNEAERRGVIQKQYEEKLQMMFRHITANESGSSSHEKLDKDSEYSKIKRENRMLKRRLADFEALFRGSEVPATENNSPPRISNHQMKRITSPPEKTTKVTRQRNKLIIQKTDCENR